MLTAYKVRLFLKVNAENGDRPADSVIGGHIANSTLFICRSALSGGGLFHAGHIRGNTCSVVIGENTIKQRRYQGRPSV